MDNTIPALRLILGELREKLCTELEFHHFIGQLIEDLEKLGLRLAVSVSENGREFAKYGDLAGQQPSESKSVTVGCLNCQFAGVSSRSKTIQHVQQADDLWRANIGALGQLFEEHWRAREATSALWTGADGSVVTKRKQTVSKAVQDNQSVAYVRLD